MKDDGVLGTIFLQFAILSLLAVGGANAVIPEVHRQAVDIQGWMTERQFADTFAMSQAAPGPNVMIVALIGFHVAGVLGALVATLAMCGPTAALACVFGRTWERFKDAPWKITVQAALVPVSVGLIAASALIVSQAALHQWSGVLIAAATAAVAFWTRWSPLWMFAVAGALGLAGWV
jgi:chromate transporter